MNVRIECVCCAWYLKCVCNARGFYSSFLQAFVGYLSAQDLYYLIPCRFVSFNKINAIFTLFLVPIVYFLKKVKKIRKKMRNKRKFQGFEEPFQVTMTGLSSLVLMKQRKNNFIVSKITLLSQKYSVKNRRKIVKKIIVKRKG